MKTTRTAGGIAGVALIAGITLFAAAPAHAAEIPVDLPDSIPAENPVDYAPTWFAGDVAGGNGTLTQGATGAVITGGTNGYQLLNGFPEDTDISLTDALYSAQVSSVGDAFYQLSVFGEADTQFTTLRPVIASQPWGSWTSSQSVAGLTAGASYSHNELIAALDADMPAQVLAFGVFVNAGDTVTLRAIAYGGDEYTFFTAQPTLALSVSSLELKNVSTPITITATGFAPGEWVTFGLGSGMSGGDIGDGPVQANAQGVATLVYTFPADAVIGEYTFGASDGSFMFGARAPFSIVANALAATGAELNPWLIATAALLALGGTGALVYARRNAVKA